MNHTARLSLSTLAAVVMTAASQGSVTTAAETTATTYYVNSASAACSDTFTGTSPAAPWCSLLKASRTYSAGDQLLIGRGSTYINQELIVTGQGTASNRIIIGTYGSGAKPKLSLGGNAARAIVLLKNPSFVSVSGLELSGAGAGVLAQYRNDFPGNPIGNESLEFNDLLVHEISGIGSSRVNGGAFDPACHSNELDLWQSGGVAVTGDYSVSVPTNSFFVSGVSFRNIEGYNNLNVVNVDTCDGRVGNPASPNPASPHLVRNVTVDNISARDGNGAGYPELCNEGMRFAGVTGLRVTNSQMANLGACFVTSGTAGIILVAVTDATFSNNTITDVPDSNSPDETGLDSEIYVDGLTMRNNLIARNAGPGVEFLSIRCNISDYNSNHSITGNTFYGNESSLKRLTCPGSTAPFSGIIDRNLTGDATFTSPVDSFTALLPTGTSNTRIQSSIAPYYAADQFSGTVGASAWSYQTTLNQSDAAAWADAGFAASAGFKGAWTGSEAASGAISRFEQTAGTCGTCASARVWTAQQSGTVAVRSLAFKSFPDGASTSVRIVRNGAVVAGPAAIASNNTTGVELNAQVSVVAGDTLRFEVSGPGAVDDWTSWAPSVAYVSTIEPPTLSGVANGSFEVPALDSGTFSYSPSGAGWTFSPLTATAGAGIAANGSGFGNATATNGTQVGIIQTQGSITQEVAGLQNGVSYLLGFDVARRGAETQTLEVIVNGAVIDTITPTSSTFSRFITPTFQAATGSQTITIRGTATSDNTAFIDNITLTQKPSVGALANGSFEAPALTSEQFSYSPSGASWSFSPLTASSGAGIAANGSGFGNANATDGSQVGIVQTQGFVTQNVSGLQAGSMYILSLDVARRGVDAQTLEMVLNGTVIGTVAPASSTFSRYAAPAFIATTGDHVITIRGGSTTDSTAFIDNVTLVQASAASGLANGSFEVPALDSGTFSYSPSGAGWTFSPLTATAGAGIAANGSGFGNATATNGTQVGIIQTQGSITQEVAGLQNGVSYLLGFDVARRGAETQTLEVIVNGAVIDTITPTSSTFSRFITPTFQAATGSQTITIRGTATSDNTAFIDNITLTQN